MTNIADYVNEVHIVELYFLKDSDVSVIRPMINRYFKGPEASISYKTTRHIGFNRKSVEAKNIKKYN